MVLYYKVCSSIMSKRNKVQTLIKKYFVKKKYFVAKKC